jgi:hypothetical protein
MYEIKPSHYGLQQPCDELMTNSFTVRFPLFYVERKQLHENTPQAAVTDCLGHDSGFELCELFPENVYM